MNTLWDTYYSNGQQYVYVNDVQRNLNLGVATLTNNGTSCAHIRRAGPDVSGNNRRSQGLEEGDRVTFTAQGWLAQAW